MSEDEASDLIFKKFLLDLRNRQSIHKRTLHSLLRLVFKKQILDTRDSTAASCLFVFGFLLDSMQLSSLILMDLAISEWNRFSPVWMIFHFSRIDYLCANFIIIEEFVIAILSICIFLSVFWMLLLASIYLKKEYKGLASVLRTLIQILAYFQITIALSLTITLKYSIQVGFVIEYPSTVRLGFGTAGVILSVLALISLYGNCLFHYKFNYDLRHSVVEKTMGAKVSSKIDLYASTVNFITVLLYAFFSNINFIFFRAVLIAAHCLILALLYQRMPYYYFPINFFKALPHIFVVTLCFTTTISYLIEDATFCILSVICLLPMSCAIYYRLLKYREAYTKALKIEDCRFCWQFELYMRENLSDQNECNAVIILDAFDKYFTMTNTESTRLIIVWLADYCLNVCNQPKAALIKLGLLPNIKTNSEIEFHEHCLLKEIKKIVFSHKNEYNILRKLIKFQEITQLDAKVCSLTLKFIFTAINNPATLNALEQLIVSLSEKLKKLFNIYMKNSKYFEDSLQMLEYYRSFVELFFCSSELLKILDLKKETMLYEVTNKEALTVFTSQDACFLLISAEDEDFGIIKYMNYQTLSILDFNHVVYANKHIKILFPESINLFNNKKLNDFKYKAFGNMNYIEKNLIVKTGGGYVKEMSVKATLMSYSRCIFLFTLKPLNFKRELAMITENGLIIEYTQGLPLLLRIEDEILGKSIERVCDIDLIQIRNSKEKIILPYLNISVLFSEIEINGIIIRIIYFFSSEYEFVGKAPSASYQIINQKKNIKSDQIYQHLSPINSIAFLASNEEIIERKFESSDMNGSFASPKLLKINSILSKKVKLMGVFKIFLMISVFHI